MAKEGDRGEAVPDLSNGTCFGTANSVIGVTNNPAALRLQHYCLMRPAAGQMK